MISSPTAIQAAVDDFVARAAPGTTLADDTPLFGLGILDSVALVNLVTRLEDDFEIEIDDPELVPANFATRAAIVAFVRAKLD